jgi:hypothetical protein
MEGDMPMKIKAIFLTDYIEASGLTAITILTFRGRAKLGFTKDLEEREKAIEKEHLGLFGEIWCRKRHHAELVIDCCRADLDAKGITSVHGWRDIEPQQLLDLVITAAATMGSKWMTTKEVNEASTSAVTKIVSTIEVMNASGGLKEINRTYKAYRQTMLATGGSAMPYSGYLNNFVRTIIRLTAASSSGIDGRKPLISGPSTMSQPNDPMEMFSPLLLAQFVKRASSNHQMSEG